VTEQGEQPDGLLREVGHRGDIARHQGELRRRVERACACVCCRGIAAERAFNSLPAFGDMAACPEWCERRDHPDGELRVFVSRERIEGAPEVVEVSLEAVAQLRTSIELLIPELRMRLLGPFEEEARVSAPDVTGTVGAFQLLRRVFPDGL